MVCAPLLHHLLSPKDSSGGCEVRADESHCRDSVSEDLGLTSSCLSCVCVFGLSSKVEMGKWIEDLNVAIDMAKKSQEKSNVFLEPGLGDHSNRKALLALLVFCRRFLSSLAAAAADKDKVHWL